jgi:pyruvate dehydrogenase E1 component alpha subunit
MLKGIARSAPVSGRPARGAPAQGRRSAIVRVVAAPTTSAAPVEFEAVNHQEKPFKADIEKLQLNTDVAKDLYKDMKLGRDFEDMCAQMYYRGKMFGFVHLYCGQEAVSTGVIRLLNKDDYVCRCASGRSSWLLSAYCNCSP